jgi:uncharacterized protein (DUF4415 family)
MYFPSNRIRGAPELTDKQLAQADLHEGGKPVRRGRGRPPSPARKVAIKFRLDPDLVAKLRASGPGYQTRVNAWLWESVFGTKRKVSKATLRRVDKLARKVALQVKPNAKTKAAARTIMRRMARDKAAAKRRQQRAKARAR